MDIVTNYLKTAWRSIAKNKISSLINISGLAVGLATAILIMLLIQEELSYDRFNTHLANTCILMKNQQQEDGISTGRSTCGLISGTLRTELPEVRYAARTSYSEPQLLKVGEKTTYESGLYAEPDFFNIMTFRALAGDPVASLKDPSSVVITDRTAKKYFGTENPIGKTFVHENTRVLKVGAVIADIPAASTTQFDIALPFALYEQQKKDWINNWENNFLLNWVEFKPGTDLDKVNLKVKKLLSAKYDDPTQTYFAYPFADFRLHGNFKNGRPSGGLIYLVWLLSITGMAVLLIACINFMNLATAQSEYRAREVGVRKTLGASRRRIIWQFLGEAFLLTFFALCMGLLLAQLVLPSFNLFSGKTLSIDFSNWQLWGGLMAIGLFTSLVAGSYPAFFLSRFQPVKVLKGRVAHLAGGAGLRKALVTFQFVVAIFMIIGTIVISREFELIRNRPMGYDQENLLDIAAKGDMTTKFKLIKTELLQIPGISHVSGGSDDLVRFGGAINGMEWPGKTPNQDFAVNVTNVGYDWVRTAGLQLAKGRDFSPEFGADSSACLLNETAVRKMGLKDPVLGLQVGGKTVIGVVKNFVFNDPTGVPMPLAIYLASGSMEHIFVRFENNSQARQHLAQIEKTVRRINPGYPFEYCYTREKFQQRIQQFGSVGQVSNLFSFLAIFISCLGLFGLSAFLAEKRTKEIGIRKVLGAGIGKIWILLSKDFLKPVLLAFLLAAPLAFWVMGNLLSQMDYHIALSWWIFVLAGLITAVISLFTVSLHALRVAGTNPVDSLKAE